MAFSTKTKGNHHLQGNVQAYNVRIPVLVGENAFEHPDPFRGNQPEPAFVGVKK